MRLAVAPKIALRKVRSRTDKNQSQILAAQRVVTHHPALIGGRSLLIQILVGRCVDCEERLESLALDKTPKRVALSLIRVPGWARAKPMAPSVFLHSRMNCCQALHRHLARYRHIPDERVAPAGLLAVLAQSHSNLLRGLD